VEWKLLGVKLWMEKGVVRIGENALKWIYAIDNKEKGKDSSIDIHITSQLLALAAEVHVEINGY